MAGKLTIAWLACVGLAGFTSAEEPGPQPPAADSAINSPAELAQRIDARVAEKWREHALSPAPLADDATIVRRLYLDLAGRIPTTSEARDYLDDPSPEKHLRLRDRLLASGDYVRWFSAVWKKALTPEAEGDPQIRFVAMELDAWLRKKLAANAPFDEIARELIMVPLPSRAGDNVFAYTSNRREAMPTAFYAAKETKPENLAAATARLFLAQRLECAECHDHPFADWKRDDFWSYAAFFAGIRRSNSGNPLAALEEIFTGATAAGLSIAIPGEDREAAARFLDGQTPDLTSSQRPRAALAEWITGRDNPYFAKATVNRLWAHFFGEGLVFPLDDMGPNNPPSHPELLEELAAAFRDSGNDLKFVISAIVASEAYRRSSAVTGEIGENLDADQIATAERFLARRQPRPLTGEQLYDSVALAIGLPPEDLLTLSFQFFGATDARAKFLEMHRGAEEMPIDQRVSASQALALMNGSLAAGATSLENSAMLAALAIPSMTASDKLESIFLATLSRRPTDAERAFLGEIESEEAWADLIWAAINSVEFAMNH